MLRTEFYERSDIKKEFDDERMLAELYQRSFNLDVCLVSISIKAEGIEDKITECISQILLCENEEWQMLGLAVYIQATKPALLLETEQFYLNFTFNKDVTIRSLIGNEKFSGLINKTVDLIGIQNRINCILLLDKSK